MWLVPDNCRLTHLFTPSLTGLFWLADGKEGKREWGLREDEVGTSQAGLGYRVIRMVSANLGRKHVQEPDKHLLQGCKV